MTLASGPWFALGSLAGWLLVVGTALRLRGRTYATYAGVALGLFTLLSVAQYPRLAFAGLLREYLQAVTYGSFLLLIWPRLRPWPYRALVSIPAAFHLAASLLSWPWAVASLLGLSLPLPWLPHAAALLGVVQSSWTRETELDLVLDGTDVGHLKRLPRSRRQPTRATASLRLLQITDPHLGPFMSVARLRKICERAVARRPDLVALTGDFLTMESRATPDALRSALAPLSRLQGRVFACMGNHDHEAPELVRTALEAAGVRLLIDEAELVETPAGRVQLLGLDHRFRNRRSGLAEACRRHPRIPGALRVLLLHDPSAFSALPPGEADLVLSGHTHGGQLGLVSLGLPWTFLSLFPSMPDHGLWGRGHDRLYVHRGTGHYGFPLRVGVPAEQSVLRVRVP